ERRVSYFQRIALADRAWLDNQPAAFLRQLQECPPSERNLEWFYLRGLADPRGVPHLNGHRSEFPRAGPWGTSVAMSRDGTRIASASYIDLRLRFWDATTGRQLWSYQPVNA